eukprot:scaffold22711_cov70-Skeletonema_dohrnii-CCMP3373.AAC.2
MEEAHHRHRNVILGRLLDPRPVLPPNFIRTACLLLRKPMQAIPTYLQACLYPSFYLAYKAGFDEGRSCQTELEIGIGMVDASSSDAIQKRSEGELFFDKELQAPPSMDKAPRTDLGIGTYVFKKVNE